MHKIKYFSCPKRPGWKILYRGENMCDIKELYNARHAEVSSYQDECGNIDGSVNQFTNLFKSKNSNVLDIGCYIGTFPYTLYKKGFKNVYGIDVASDAIKHGHLHYPEIEEKLIECDDENIPFSDAEFDIVTMFNVVEHLKDPEKYLVEVYRVMKKGAFLLIQTPNKPYDVIYETFKYRSLRWREYHCALQTSYSLRRLLKRSGFSNFHLIRANLGSQYYKNKLETNIGKCTSKLLPLMVVLPVSVYPVLTVLSTKK